MNHLTRRTMLQSGGMLGAVLALDAVSPALAGTTPAASSVRFKAIDARLAGQPGPNGAPPAASPGQVCSTATSGRPGEARHRRALHPGLALLRRAGRRA